MSMILVLESVPSDGEQSKELVTTASEFLSEGAATDDGLKIFNGYEDETDDDFDAEMVDEFEQDFLSGSNIGDSLTLEKAWHCLHFLLTNEAWGGEGWLAFLVVGGTELGEDEGYGPARIFAPSEVVEIARELERVDGEDLWAKFDPEELKAADIYPNIWDEDEEGLREEYLDYFEELKAFVLQVAENGESLRLELT